MTPEDQARRLADWLELPSGTDAPEDLDPEVVEAIIALRPERAPPPSVSVEDILGSVETGPFASASPMRELPPTLDAPIGGGGEVVDFAAAKRRRRPWLLAFGGIGGVGTLVAAAAVLLIIVPRTPEMMQATSQPDAASTPTNELARPTEKPAETAPLPVTVSGDQENLADNEASEVIPEVSKAGTQGWPADAQQTIASRPPTTGSTATKRKGTETAQADKAWYANGPVAAGPAKPSPAPSPQPIPMTVEDVPSEPSDAVADVFDLDVAIGEESAVFNVDAVPPPPPPDADPEPEPTVAEGDAIAPWVSDDMDLDGLSVAGGAGAGQVAQAAQDPGRSYDVAVRSEVSGRARPRLGRKAAKESAGRAKRRDRDHAPASEAMAPMADPGLEANLETEEEESLAALRDRALPSDYSPALAHNQQAQTIAELTEQVDEEAAGKAEQTVATPPANVRQANAAEQTIYWTNMGNLPMASQTASAALSVSQENTPERSYLLWAYGNVRLQLGDAAGARAAFTQAAALNAARMSTR